MRTIIITILVVLNIILVLRIQYERKVFRVQQENEIFQENEMAHSLYKNYKYECQDVHINNMQENFLDTIIDSKYKLFFKIPVSYCDACVKPMLNELKSIIGKVDKDRIVIITSFPTKSEINDFIYEMEIYGLNVLNIPDNDFTLDTKELIGAYLFILNEDFKAKKVFFCSKFNAFCNSFYLKAIIPYLE